MYPATPSAHQSPVAESPAMPGPSSPVATEHLLHLLDCGIALFDQEGQVLFWNTWLRDASGISSEGTKGKSLRSIFGDQVSPRLIEALKAACIDGVATVLPPLSGSRPLPLQSRQGRTLVPMEHSVSLLPLPRKGKMGHAACVMQVYDVTSSLRRERYLSQSQAELRLRNRALETSSQGVVIVDARSPDFPVIYANPAFCSVTGYSEAEILGRNCRFLQGEDSEQPGLKVIRQALKEHREGIAILRNYRKDGTPFWNELLVSPVFDDSGVLTNFVGIQRDISQRRHAEESRNQAVRELSEANEKLAEANEKLDREQKMVSTVMRTSGALVAVLDRRGRILSFNRACEVACGCTADSVRGMRLADLIVEEHAADYFQLDGSPRERPQGIHSTLRRSSGEQRTIRWTFGILDNDDGTAEQLICTGIDVTERERAMALLSAERVLLEMVARVEPLPRILTEICKSIQHLLPGMIAAILLLDDNGTIFTEVIAPDLPPAYEQMVVGLAVGPGVGSCGVAALYGRPHYTYDIATDPNWEAFRSEAATMGLHSSWSVPVLTSARVAMGTFVAYGLHPGLPDSSTIEILHRAARIASISIEQHRAAERIRYLALYDQLTGLANRTLLSDRLHTGIAHALRHQSQLALLFIDLDGFKPINDVYGHDAGDTVLATLGQRLKGVLRTTDTAARIGGDEFVILAEELQDSRDAARVADKVLSVLGQSISWHGREVRVGASIGIALYPRDGRDADSLLTSADNAMYRAKQGGKNHWVMASPEGGGRP